MAETKKTPRIRKIETVRERNEKAGSKPAEGSFKPKRGFLRPLGKVISPIVGMLRTVLSPLNIKPVRFIGRWLGLILLPRYFRNAYKEVRQVVWPSWKQTWKLTFAVLIFAFVFGVFITAADYGFDKIIRRIVLR